MGGGPGKEKAVRVRGKIRAVGRLALEERLSVLAPARRYLRTRPTALDCFLSEEHGFLPAAPVPKLPASHAIWEKAIRDLPRVLSSGGDVREMMSSMPLRSAGEMALPDEHLLRAATLLGCFVHATWHFSSQGDDVLPDSIKLPWAEVSHRLGRPRAHLTLLDYATHNYEFRVDGVDSLSNVDVEETESFLRPSARAFGNHAEAVVIMFVIKIQRLMAAAISPILQAQESVMRDDTAGLQRALVRLRDKVELMTAAIKTMCANPYSSACCDAVSYGKTVNRFTRSIPEHEATAATKSLVNAKSAASMLRHKNKVATGHQEAESATTLAHGKLDFTSFSSLLSVLSVSSGSPLHVLDAVLGTDDLPIESNLVELAQLHGREWTPHLHLVFINHLKEISVRDYVQNSKSPDLVAVFDGLVESFAGIGGYLDEQRRQIHAYEEVAMVVAERRLPTDLRDGGDTWGTAPSDATEPTWRKLCKWLDQARSERYRFAKIGLSFAETTLIHRAAIPNEAGIQSKASHLIIDVESSGMLFEAGDRCAVLAINDTVTVDRTIRALGVHETTPVQLNKRWVLGLALQNKQPSAQQSATLEMKSFLEGAVLSPLNHHVTAMLTELITKAVGNHADQRLTECESVGELSSDKIPTEESIVTLVAEFELWRLLQLIGELGVDMRATIVPFLAELLPPLTDRTYSICSAPDRGTSAPQTLHFTVGKYEVEEDESDKWAEVMNYVYDALQPDPEALPSRTPEPELEGVLVSTPLQRLLATGDQQMHVQSIAKVPLRRLLSSAIRTIWDEWNLLSTDSGSVGAVGDTLNVMKPNARQHETTKRLLPEIYSEFDAVHSVTDAAHSTETDKATRQYADSSGTFVHGAATLSSAASGPQNRSATRRDGVSSHFLHRLSTGDKVRVGTRAVQHFRTPYRERRCPIIMVACGGGIATYRSFMEERMRLRSRGVEVGEMWLIWGAHSRSHICYRKELEYYVQEELLTVDVALSHGDYQFTCKLEGDKCISRISNGTGPRSLETLLAAPHTMSKLWYWLEAGAIVYIAGHARGVSIVRNAVLNASLAEQSSLNSFSGSLYCQTLIADNRIRTDVTTSARAGVPCVSLAELARHDGGTQSAWTSYKGRVIEMNESIVVEAATWYPSGLVGLLHKTGRDCTSDFTLAACNSVATARMEGLIMDHHVADLRCMYFDEDEADEQDLYLAWRSFLCLVVELRNSLRIEIHASGVVCSHEDVSNLARSQVATWVPRRLTNVEDGFSHRKFMRLTMPLLCSRMIELADRTMPMFDEEAGMPIQILTGVRDRIERLMSSAELKFCHTCLSPLPGLTSDELAAFRSNFVETDLKWLVDLVECAAAGLEEIEKSLGHLSNLEALMRRRIGEMYPELEACFRRTDRDNSGLIDKHELAEMLTSMGIEFDQPQMDKLMRKLDRNADGFVSFSEFLSAMRVGPYGKRGKEGALVSLAVILPSKLNDMITFLQRTVSILALARLHHNGNV